MRSGCVPASSSRVTRSVSTLVLPVPALASTQDEWAGAVARRCSRLGELQEIESVAHSSPPPAVDHSVMRSRCA